MEVDTINGRYLLCRPRHGLNNIFNHIEHCWRHAEKFGRTLIIDPQFIHGLVDLSQFLVLGTENSNIVLNASDHQLRELNKLSCMPRIVSGKINDYDITLDIEDHQTSTKELIPASAMVVDLSVDHPEPLIIWHQRGGMKDSLDFLKRVKLESGLAKEVLDKITKIGPNYAAVHIRSTDYATDWRPFLKKIRKDLSGRKVVVCSDNFEAIQDSRLILKESTVVTVSEIPYQDGKPLHRRDIDNDAKNRVIRDAFTDLLALSAASDLYITPTKTGVVSGFSILAGAICRQKSILNILFANEAFSDSKAVGNVHLVRTARGRFNLIIFKFSNAMKTKGINELTKHIFRKTLTYFMGGRSI